MKKQNSLKYNLIIALGIIFLVTAGFLIGFNRRNAQISSSVLSIGITMIIIGIIRKIRQSELVKKDERIKKLSLYGLSYSWITTFILITVLFWFDYFGFLNITTQTYYSIVFATMIISAIAFQKFLYNKGDIE